MSEQESLQEDATQDLETQLQSQHQSGAQWFYWIAALSLVNSAASWFGSDWGFVIGLGITQVFDAFATVLQEQLGPAVRFAAFGASLLVAGTFVLFGVISGRRSGLAYVLGMTLYTLDGLLFLLVADWLSLGFHVFALFFIARGYLACRKLAALSPAPAIGPETVVTQEDPRFAEPASR